MFLLTRTLHRVRDERGFTLVIAMLAMMIALAVTGTAYMAVSGDTRSTAYNQDEKNAYAAAQAGLSWYQIQLAKDPSYWSSCAAVPTVSGHAAPVWDGLKTSTRNWADVTSPSTVYTGISPTIASNVLAYNVEILPANGNNACVANQDSSVVDNTYGVFRVRVAGRSGGATRALVATFRRKGFLDYLYYTQYETLDPNLSDEAIGVGGWSTRLSLTDAKTFPQWATENCADKAYALRQGQTYSSGGTPGQFQPPFSVWKTFSSAPPCADVSFSRVGGVGDQVNGPLHTADPLLVCGNPIFGAAATDKIEVEASPTYRDAAAEALWGCGTPAAPQFTGTLLPNAAPITPPSPNGNLASASSACCLFQGETRVVLKNDGTMDVYNAARYPNGKNIPQPPSGVIYASTAGTCTGYKPENVDADDTTCGDLRVSGWAKQSLTLGADNDIVVTGNLQPDPSTPNALIGLIALNGYVRVAHPVGTTMNDPIYGYLSAAQLPTQINLPAPAPAGQTRSFCNSGNSTTPPVMSPITIQAAILALSHSFMVDNWRCGTQMANLNVTGAIAQKYRGPIGCNACKPAALTPTGYVKNYLYDPRLKYRSPPAFLAPVQSAWRTVRVQEQAGAAKIAGR